MINLTSERLRLRQFKNTDVSELFEIIQEKEIKQFLPGVYTDSIKELKEALNIYMNADFKDDIYLAITDKKTQNLIGAIILVRIFKNNMEIAYFMCKRKRGMGLMLEALQTFIDWYAQRRFENNIIFAVSKSNNASLALCTKMEKHKIPIFNVAENVDTVYYMIRPMCLH